MAKETKQKQLTGAAPAAMELSANTQKALDAVKQLSDKDFYSVGGKLVPGARAMQHLANEAGGITTQIMDSVTDELHAAVRVRGWFVKEPELFKEDLCSIVFSTAYEMELWRLYEKGCPAHAGKGCPIKKDADGNAVLGKGNVPQFDDNRCHLHAIQNFLRIKNFADRTCVTKAESRVHAKLLNAEWREDEEIEEERREVEIVAGAGKDAKALEQGKPASAAKPAADAAKPAATEAKKEDPKPKEQAQPAVAQPAAAQAAAGTPPPISQRVAGLAKSANVTDNEMLAYICRACGVQKATDAGRKNLQSIIKVLETFLNESGSAALSNLVQGKSTPEVANSVAEAYEKEVAS